MNRKSLALVALFVFAVAPVALTETDTVLLLHTNDLHDHARPGYDGQGGLPYVAGYIQQVRSERPDTLLLDGGDVTEKGDMVAFASKGVLMYEAMGRIGYDAGVPGNHDWAYGGIPHLRKCAAAAKGMDMLCANILGDGPEPLFPASKVYDVDGVKVGVIGLARPGSGGDLVLDRCAEVLAKEAAALEPEVHLLVVVCHYGSRDCIAFSRQVPAIDVFVSGHTHELLAEPVVVSATGARIVQAGDFARYVGRLELTIDLDTKEVVQANGEVVPMMHDKVSCDEGMLAWIHEQEQALCPQATRVVGRCDAAVIRANVGCLVAAALRAHGMGDVGFCSPKQVLRGNLPLGVIDVNALFVTGGQRGHTVVRTELTGAQIEGYLRFLADGRLTEWAGFQADVKPAKAPKIPVVETTLEPTAAYSVILTEREWESEMTRFLKTLPDGPKPESAVCPFTFTEALTAYVLPLTAQDIPIDAHVKVLAEAQELQTALVP